MTTAGKRPQPAPGVEDEAQLDPLEELARIMNDGNPTDPARHPAQPPDDEAGAAPADEALDLGLGADGLERYFQDPGSASGAQLSGSFGATGFQDTALPEDSFSHDGLVDPLQSAAAKPDDDVLAGLDFNNLDLPGLDDPIATGPTATDPIAAPQPPEQAAVMPEPLLSQHLTPRQPQPQPQPLSVDPLEARPMQPPPASSVAVPIAEADLLAAMDQLALDDDPAWSSKPADDPVSEVALDTEPATGNRTFDAEAEPSFTPFSGRSTPPDGLVDEPAHTFGADDAQPLDHDASERGGGAGRTIALALGLLALIGLGGVIAYGLFVNNGPDSGSPQLIAAPEGENKQEPQIATSDERVPGQAVFSALDDGGQGTEASPRVVLPGPGSTPLDLGGNTPPPRADIAPAAPGSTAARPVRTVTVRADGTVVESTSSPAVAGATQATPQQTAPQQAAPAQTVASPRPVPVQTVTSQIGAVALDAPAASQTRNEARLPTDQAVATPSEGAPVVTAAPAAPPQPTARPAATPQSVVAQPAASGPATVNQPIQLTAPTAAPTAPATTPAPAQVAAIPAQPSAPATQGASAQALPSSVAPGDFVVQLASLRSQEQARATFSNLQNRFGSILTGFSPNIQEVDLGDRGIYHRVRLGPMDRADADSLCQRYQAAGGDCFVQRQ